VIDQVLHGAMSTLEQTSGVPRPEISGDHFLNLIFDPFAPLVAKAE